MYECECGGKMLDNGEDLICTRCGNSYMDRVNEEHETSGMENYDNIPGALCEEITCMNCGACEKYWREY